MIEPRHTLSIRRQSKLLGLSASILYYQPQPQKPLELELMNRIDALHLEEPTWGSRKLRDALRLEGYKVNRKRIQRLMRKMAIQSIYPKKKLSMAEPGSVKYPYLLRYLNIDRPGLVWCTDITYIRLGHGFVYLVAVMDWYSKKILSWQLSNTLDKHFCIWALDEALRKYQSPSIFNSDQGSQFTCEDFLRPLLERDVRISMDGKGRALDNVAIERFWRTLKYDEVYLKEYESMADAKVQIGRYIESYNSRRPHQALGGITPNMAYTGTKHMLAA